MPPIPNGSATNEPAAPIAAREPLASPSPTPVVRGRIDPHPAIPSATVVVLYHPSAEDIAQVMLLAEQGRLVFAVINAIAPDRDATLPVREGLTFIRNTHNVGLARALNQGLTAADDAGARYTLLLDQDSRPAVDMVDRLVAVAAEIEAEGRALACVAPVLHDRKFGAIAAPSTASNIVSTATFATSGTLVTQRGWQTAGPMWDDLFIDGIDHEWCFRARSHGLETVQIPGIVMEHDMGEDAIDFFGHFKPVHRSPIRHYFIVRNTLWMLRRSHIPVRWRMSEAIKLAYRVPAYIWFSVDKPRSIRNLAGAIVDGIRQSNTHQPVARSTAQRVIPT